MVFLHRLAGIFRRRKKEFVVNVRFLGALTAQTSRDLGNQGFRPTEKELIVASDIDQTPVQLGTLAIVDAAIKNGRGLNFTAEEVDPLKSRHMRALQPQESLAKDYVLGTPTAVQKRDPTIWLGLQNRLHDGNDRSDADAR